MRGKSRRWEGHNSQFRGSSNPPHTETQSPVLGHCHKVAQPWFMLVGEIELDTKVDASRCPIHHPLSQPYADYVANEAKCGKCVFWGIE